MPTTERSWPVFETADRIVPGGLSRFLLDARSAGKSYREISEELLELNIVVSYVTVSAWVKRIENENGTGPWS